MMRRLLGSPLSNKTTVHFEGARAKELRAQRNLVWAAEQHVLWKNRLGHHIQGAINEPLDSGLVGQDGICQLGSWIKGAEFHGLRDTQAYRELDFAHTLFHEFGAEIIEKLKHGNRAGADFTFKNEYTLAMQHIIQALTKIDQLLQER